MGQCGIVDPSFIDLVVLGVLPADDPSVVNSLAVIDARLGVSTAGPLPPSGVASFDGYGEKTGGSQ